MKFLTAVSTQLNVKNLHLLGVDEAGPVPIMYVDGDKLSNYFVLYGWLSEDNVLDARPSGIHLNFTKVDYLRVGSRS